MSLRPEDVVGPYVVIRPLAVGGVAAVFEVEHRALGSRHALKVLQDHLVARADVRSRFLTEGRLHSSLNHPGIVRVTDVIAEPGVAGLVMDLLVGETLADRIDRCGPVPLSTALVWMDQILDAMAHAHDHGVVHRDLKPDNLFLAGTPGTERAVVLDFGVAQVADHRQTNTLETLGTAAYMSPEQVLSPKDVDKRSDIYALGTVLYELLAAEPAFAGGSAFDTMQRVVAGRFVPLSQRVPEIPPHIDAAVDRALRTNPDDRHRDCMAFRDALFHPSHAAPAPPAPAETPPAAVAAPRRRLVGPLIGLLGLGVLIAGVVVLRPWLRPEIKRLEVSADACGRWQVVIDASGRGGELVVSANGTEVGRAVIDGHQQDTFRGRGLPGTRVLLQAALPGAAARSEAVDLSPWDAVIVLDGPTTWPEGATPQLAAHAETLCPLWPELIFSARVAGSAPLTGVVAADGTFTLTPPPLVQGDHPLALRLMVGDQVLRRDTVQLEVGPPCLDRDGDGITTCQGDCDDADAAVHPGATEIGGDGIDNDCDGREASDEDGDGYASRAWGGGDCDDHNAQVNPGAAERSAPNGVDDDCDGRIDEGTVAYDDDGDGVSEQDGDCDDTDPDRRPGATEYPDCRDQDCDAEIDEGVTLPEVDDAWEPDDSKDQAQRLGVGSERSMRETVRLVSRNRSDQEWFRLYSRDGLFDDWGIFVTADRLPTGASYRVEVRDAAGGVRGSQVLETDGAQLAIGGRAFHDDTGEYTVRIVPLRLPRDWCPAQFTIHSR